MQNVGSIAISLGTLTCKAKEDFLRLFQVPLVQLSHGEPQLGIFTVKPTLGPLAETPCVVQSMLKQCFGPAKIVSVEGFVPLLKRLRSNLKRDLVFSIVLFGCFQTRKAASERGRRTFAER